VYDNILLTQYICYIFRSLTGSCFAKNAQTGILQKFVNQCTSFTNVCNISMYPSFVKHLPEDGHVMGRNM